MPSSRTSAINRWSEGRTKAVEDQLAVEEPLQVVVDGRPLAVLMRTPGDDHPLVTGFLLTEGIIVRG
jgi:FdhD protein